MADQVRFYYVYMTKPDGTEAIREYLHEPNDERLNELALEIGHKEGDIFPDFSVEDPDGDFLMAGGGLNSGYVGIPFADTQEWLDSLGDKTFDD